MPHPFRSTSACLSIALLLMSCADPKSAHGDSSIAQSWQWQPSKENWRITGELLAPANVSAIASVDGQSFLIGSDDLSIAQYGTIDRTSRTLNLQGNVPLFKGNDRDEIDIEGIAAAPTENAYYVTGSHSLTKKGNMNKERRTVFQVRQDRKSHNWDEIDRASLQDLIRNHSILKPFWEVPLQEGGINIEGLAWKGDHLFFGFRSPNVDEHALVLEVPGRDLFKKGDDKHTLHQVPLGRGLGIRELATIREGFLLVAGNAGDGPTKEYPSSRDYVKGRPYAIYFWDPVTNTVELLSTLTRPGRPEAMLVLADSDNATEVLLLFDGIDRGAPMAYTIIKR